MATTTAPSTTPSYDKLCPQASDPANPYGKFCVYSEKQEGDKVADRSFRVLKISEYRDEFLVYTGDINGDGVEDRFEGRFHLGGNGIGTLRFGNFGSDKMPTTFRNSSWQNLSVGQKVKAHSNDGGRFRDEITGFRLVVSSPFGVFVPEYALITVEAILKSGGIFNIDHLEGF